MTFFDELLRLGMGLLPGGISCSEYRWMIELQFPRSVGSAAMRDSSLTGTAGVELMRPAPQFFARARRSLTTRRSSRCSGALG